MPGSASSSTPVIKTRFFIAFLLFTGLSLTPVSAQQEAAGDIEPEAPSSQQSIGSVTVYGKQKTGDELRRQAVDYVDRSGVIFGQRVVARWVDPICPRILGISERQAEIVVQRIKDVAQQVGAPVARGACRANITIMFSGDNNEMIGKIRRKRQSQFREVPTTSRKALFEGSLPTRWWYRTGERPSRGGEHSGKGDPPSVGVAGANFGGGQAGGNYGNNLGNGNVYQQYKSSLISTKSLRALETASLMIEADEVSGLSLDSIGSYAAMVTLAEMRFDAGPYDGSILGLFESGGPFDGLTDRDLAFLTTLYSLPMDRSARAQKGMLVRALLDQSKAVEQN
ncbi:MAG: hypothetical protein AAFX04_09865 [Pseudomonadota bacterium]